MPNAPRSTQKMPVREDYLPRQLVEIRRQVAELRRKVQTSWNGSSGRMEFHPSVVELVAVAGVYTPDSDAAEIAVITAPAADFTVARPAGTPGDGDTMTLRIRSAASAQHATWAAGYLASGRGALPQPVAGRTVVVDLVWDAQRSAWVTTSVDQAGY